MAVTTPLGKIWLLKNIPFSKNYNHTKYFSDKTTQHNWICGENHYAGSGGLKEGQNYIKNPLQGTIKIAAHQENYLDCNYICFVNNDIADGGTQNFYNYAFVDSIEYISNGVIQLDYTIDVLQTYLFQGLCVVKDSFIIRTHTQSDKVGEHIEPENISFGTQKITHRQKLLASDFDILVFASEFIDPSEVFGGDSPQNFDGKRCGLFQGLYVEVIPQSRFKDFMTYVHNHTSSADAIMAIVAVPQATVQAIGFVDGNYDYLLDSSNSIWNATESRDIDFWDDSLDGYTPTNKKLYTYPYNMLCISNGSNIQEMEFEKINKKQVSNGGTDSNSKDKFLYRSVLSVQPNPEYMIIPINYQLSTSDGQLNIDKSLTLNDFQKIPWNSDSFSRWLSYNGVSSAVSVVGSALAGGMMGAMAGGVGALPGAAVGAVGGLANVGLQGAQEAVKPTQSLGSISGNALQALGEYNIYMYRKNLYREDAERIDNFFSRFGYAINKIEKIEFTNERFNQHYIQTKDCLVVGGACSQVIEKIENIFNSGITIWRNTVGDYTL